MRKEQMKEIRQQQREHKRNMQLLKQMRDEIQRHTDIAYAKRSAKKGEREYFHDNEEDPMDPLTSVYGGGGRIHSKKKKKKKSRDTALGIEDVAPGSKSSMSNIYGELGIEFSGEGRAPLPDYMDYAGEDNLDFRFWGILDSL